MKIEAKGLVKNYGPREVIKNLSFTLNSGEILGFLGPNGAGKTTVMRLLAGYHFPDSGTILFDGVEPGETSYAYKNSIGYLPENVPLYSDMTPLEYLAFIAGMRHIKKNEQREAVQKTLVCTGLKNREHQKIETLSRGYKQRLGLAQALVHDPAIILLDEPFSGLDPNQIMEMRALVKELGKGKAIVFSTHILQEAESVCTRYLILNEGRVAAEGVIDSDTRLEDIFLNSGGGENS